MWGRKSKSRLRKGSHLESWTTMVEVIFFYFFLNKSLMFLIKSLIGIVVFWISFISFFVRLYIAIWVVICKSLIEYIKLWTYVHSNCCVQFKSNLGGDVPFDFDLELKTNKFWFVFREDSNYMSSLDFKSIIFVICSCCLIQELFYSVAGVMFEVQIPIK